MFYSGIYPARNGGIESHHTIWLVYKPIATCGDDVLKNSVFPPQVVAVRVTNQFWDGIYKFNFLNLRSFRDILNVMNKV